MSTTNAMNEPPYPSFSELSDDILSHSLSFLDDEDFMKSACHLEDTYPSSSQIMECAGRRWKALWDLDQQQAYPQWKPQNVLLQQCSQKHDDDESEVLQIARQTGRNFIQDRNMTRHLSQLSHQHYDYNRTPVPFFCPVPTKGAGLDCYKELSLSPSAWPRIQDRNRPSENEFVFLNLSFRDGNCVYRLWEGYRPIESCTSSQFRVSLVISAHRQKESSNIDMFKPLELFHRKLVSERHQTQHEQESEEKASDLQLATLLRKLQVTTVYGGELVVATGGCQLVLSATKGQFHDRPYSPKIQQRSFSSISTTIEFCVDESEKPDRICFQVSRS